jgi:hypothetical protein
VALNVLSPKREMTRPARPGARAVRDLAVRGAEALREERSARSEAHEHLRRIATGEDDRYDFAVSERLHASR